MDDRPRRVLIKLSGEALLDEGQDFGIHHRACRKIAQIIQSIYDTGVQIGIVVGAGNIFRGKMGEEFCFERTAADHIGLLATAINGLALGQSLSNLGCRVRVVSARNLDGIVETYNWMQAKLYMDKHVILVFVAGTGNPYFTTDTAAALRAAEMNCDELIKATQVDGVYEADPLLYPHAARYDHITYRRALSENLRVMDGAAIALCRENRVPIRVVKLTDPEAMLRAAVDGTGGTLVTGE